MEPDVADQFRRKRPERKAVQTGVSGPKFSPAQRKLHAAIAHASMLSPRILSLVASSAAAVSIRASAIRERLRFPAFTGQLGGVQGTHSFVGKF